MRIRKVYAYSVVILLLQALIVATFVVGAGATSSQLVYSEDFEDSSSGWLIYSDEDLDYGYEDGRYTITVRQPNRTQWTWAPLSSWVPADFFIQVVVESSAGAEGRYGILWGTDDDNFYAFWVDNEGGYGLDHYRNGQWQEAAVPRSTSSAIEQAAANQLEVTVEGSSVTLTINGEIIKRLDQPSLGQIGVGLVVYTREPAQEDQISISIQIGPFQMSAPLTSEEEMNVEVYFDDLVVYSE